MGLALSPLGASVVIGKINGNVYQRGRFGQVVRAYRRPVNPNGPRQQLQTFIFSQMSDAWLNSLTETQRIAWSNYASGTIQKGKLGNDITIAGRNAYFRSNYFPILFGTPGFDDAPTTPGGCSCFTPAFDANTTDGIAVSGVTPTIPANETMVVWISRAYNQTVNYFKGPFENAVNIVHATTFPQVLIPDTDLTIGQKYFAAVKRIDAEGKCSDKLIISLPINA